MDKQLEANFSTLILSMASSASMALGLAPDPTTQKTSTNLQMAEFNIDLLKMLKDKTQNNLTSDEQKFLDVVITDLQMKFIESRKKG